MPFDEVRSTSCRKLDMQQPQHDQIKLGIALFLGDQQALFSASHEAVFVSVQREVFGDTFELDAADAVNLPPETLVPGRSLSL